MFAKSLNSGLLIAAVGMTMAQPWSRAHAAPPQKGSESNICKTALKPENKVAAFDKLLKSPDVAWGITQGAINDLRKRYENADTILSPLYTGLIANEFVWLNGDFGGGKTSLSSAAYKAELKSVPFGQRKIFILQLHKLLNEGVIVGTPNLKKMLERGVYEINTKNSLADNFVLGIFDEVEKGTPALQATFLSFLNERKVFLGSHVVESLLRSGVSTSNKTIAKLVEDSGSERAMTEAYLDRQRIKVHVFHQNIDSKAMQRAMAKQAWSRQNPMESQSAGLALSKLVKKVKVPREMIEEMVSISRKLDAFYTEMRTAADNSRRMGERDLVNFFPPNQFSTRSMIGLLKIWKSAFLARQLMAGVPFEQIRFEMQPSDLRDLAVGSILNGPGEIRGKTVPVKFVLKHPMMPTVRIHEVDDAAWDPIAKRLYFSTIQGESLFVDFDPTSGKVLGGSNYVDSTGLEINAAQHVDVAQLTSAIKEKQAEIEKIDGTEFEDNGFINRALGLQRVTPETREELGFILKARTVFLTSLDASLKKLKGKKLDFNLRDEKAVLRRLAIEKRSGELASRFEKIRTGEVRVSKEEYIQFASETVRQTYQELTSDYKEVDYVIRADLAGLIGRNHVLKFGPPGSGKTEISNTLLQSVLASMNAAESAKFYNELTTRYRKVLDEMKARTSKLHRVIAKAKKRGGRWTKVAEKLEREIDDFSKYELWFRQLHKMVPEGEILGFTRLDEQLDTGTIRYSRTNSLSHRRFYAAIIDEIDKGNPALLQTLLSILEDGTVMAGFEQVTTSLATAILTSNKVVYELLAAFGSDRPTGEALLNRMTNKVYMLNKIAKDENMTNLLLEIESGTFNPRINSPTLITTLQPILGRIQIPSEVSDVLGDVYFEFLERRAAKMNELYKQHVDDPVTSPYAYMPATRASIRSDVRLFLSQLQSVWLVDKILDGSFEKMVKDQAAQGLTWDQMTFEVGFEDAPLLAQGLAYWAPYTYVKTQNSDGVLQIEADTSQLQSHLKSGVISKDVEFQIERIIEEIEDFRDILNSHLVTTVQQNRELIGENPNLYRGLITAPRKTNQKP